MSSDDMVDRGQKKAPVAFDRSQRLCRCADVGAGKPSRAPKQSTRPEFECWIFSSFPELVSWNRSACGRGNAGCYAGRLAPAEFLQQRSSTRTVIGNLVQSVKVLFVQRRREKITTDRHFADGEGEVACQSSLRHVAASADRKRRRNVLRFFVDGQE